VSRAVGESAHNVVGNQEEEILRGDMARLVVGCKSRDELVAVHAQQLRLEVVEIHVDAFAGAGIVCELEEAAFALPLPHLTLGYLGLIYFQR
jgi:hypothetical protein